jgi:hypothetical protein
LEVGKWTFHILNRPSGIRKKHFGLAPAHVKC